MSMFGSGGAFADENNHNNQSLHQIYIVESCSAGTITILHHTDLLRSFILWLNFMFNPHTITLTPFKGPVVTHVTVQRQAYKYTQMC